MDGKKILQYNMSCILVHFRYIISHQIFRRVNAILHHRQVVLQGVEVHQGGFYHHGHLFMQHQKIWSKGKPANKEQISVHGKHRLDCYLSDMFM